jgi:hypothetical protein
MDSGFFWADIELIQQQKLIKSPILLQFILRKFGMKEMIINMEGLVNVLPLEKK